MFVVLAATPSRSMPQGLLLLAGVVAEGLQHMRTHSGLLNKLLRQK